MNIEEVALDRLKPWDGNPRKTHAVEAIARSISQFGYTAPIIVQKGTYRILAGHGRLEALRHLKRDKASVIVVDLSDSDAALYTLADNQIAATSEWDFPKLARTLKDLDDLGADVSLSGFTPGQLDRLSSWTPFDDDEEPPVPAELPAKPITRPGDVWTCGRHLLACGDCRQPLDVARVLGKDRAQLMITDPPYCSGSFQEAGKAAGTWGDIASDNLSTRGYIALMRSMLATARVQTSYIFTDWRMWIPLFDVTDSSGLAVRSMIVWDKGTPGLGALWRTQHEIVMFASRTGNRRQKGMPSRGNVLKSKRTGNVHHYTEKPVDLIQEIIKGDEPSGRKDCPIYDPFCGSGSTLLAAERQGRRALCMDVEPRWVDVAVRRWQAMTGKKAHNPDRKIE